MTNPDGTVRDDHVGEYDARRDIYVVSLMCSHGQYII